jgi:Leucine-rich repeat (LRR) protein
VIVPARVTILCPEECYCDIRGYFLSCSRTPLNPLPLNHLTDIRILGLSEMKITSLEKDSFVSQTELQELYISECGLITIELVEFNGLTELKLLSLWGNNISEKIPGIFDNMNSLKYLGLLNNRLEHLDIDVFSGLVNLKRINLRVNKLRYLHPDTVLGLPNLQELDLGKNVDLQVPTDRNLIKSHSLSILDISECNVISVTFETFANVSKIKWLGMSDNNLRNVDINTELFISQSGISKKDCATTKTWTLH